MFSLVNESTAILSERVLSLDYRLENPSQVALKKGDAMKLSSAYFDRDDMDYDEIVWGELNLRQIEEVVRRCCRYGASYFQGFADPFVQQFTTRKSVDTDGYPFEIDYVVSKRKSDGSSSFPEWSLGVHYEDTTGEQYDFIESHARDTTTAYKRGRNIKPTDVKFRLVRCYLPDLRGEKIAAAYNDIIRLNEFFKTVEAAIASLDTWASSQFHMGVYCKSCSSRKAVNQDTMKQLHSVGHTLETMQARLSCQKCGKRDASIYPLGSGRS